MKYEFFTIRNAVGDFFLAMVPRTDRRTKTTVLLPKWSRSKAHRWRFPTRRLAEQQAAMTGGTVGFEAITL